jgi:type I restriction enzyme S subunit
MGKTAVAGHECVTNQQINSIIVSDAFSPDFIYYNLSARKAELQNLAGGGSAQPILNKGHFVDLPILLPPLHEQRGIAQVLASLDNKIELNLRMNETLEALAKVLFQSSFASVTATGLREGWRTGKLGEVLVAIETGGRPKGGVKDISEGVPSVGAESIVGIGHFDYEKTRFVPRQFFDEMFKGHVVDGDVLLYKDGGRPGEFEPHVTMVGDGFPFAEFCINEHVYRLRSNPRIPQSYLYFWLTSESAMEDMRNRGTGVAIPGLNSTQVRELAILIPPAIVVNSFDKQVAPLIHRIFANCNESRTLAGLRNALLRKLLLGEVRVTL